MSRETITQQQLDCLRGNHDDDVSVVVKTGITENPSPTQELFWCKHCKCLFVPQKNMERNLS